MDDDPWMTARELVLSTADRHREQARRPPADDDGIDELLALAELVAAVLPDALLAHVHSTDFRNQQTAAALRALRGAGLNLDLARAQATHRDVAGALDAVRAFVDVVADRPPGRWLWLLWHRRAWLLSAERLEAVAAELSPDLSPFQLVSRASAAVDRALAEVDAAMTPGSVPEALPAAVPTPARVLGEHTTLALEDRQVPAATAAMVASADRRVLMVQPWLRPHELVDPVLEALVERARAGVAVLLVTRPVRGDDPHGREVKRALVQAGVRVAWHRYVHDKLTVADDAVLCGSANLTPTDAARNPNSALATRDGLAVEQFARRVEALANEIRLPPPRVGDAGLPVFGLDGPTGLTHRLGVPGDAMDRLEGRTGVPADCGAQVAVDTVSRLWSLVPGERCGACTPLLA